MTLRLGLVGVGRWGRNYIATVASLPGLSLSHVASRNPETPRLLPPGCRITEDWKELCRPEAVDGLIIATPPATHVPIALAAVEAGIPVLVEKPLSLAPKEARQLLGAARQRDVPVMVDHVYLFHPGYQRLKELTSSAGPIQRIASTGGGPGPARADTPPLWDWAPHDLAFCLDLLKRKPVSARSKIIERRATADGPRELFQVELEFSEGVSARITGGNLMKRKTRRLEVHCRDNSFVFDAYDQSPPAASPGDRPLSRAVRHWAESILSKRRDFGSLEMAADAVDILFNLGS